MDPLTEQDERRPLDDRLAAELAATLGWPPRTGCRDLGGGWTTNVLARPAGQPLVARVHRRTTDEPRLRAEQAARTALVAAGIPAVAPLVLPGGDTVARLPGGHLVEVEPYRDAAVRMNDGPRLVAGFGLLARVHDALSRVELPAAADAVPFANHLEADATEPAIRVGAERIRGWHDAELTRFAGTAVAHLTAVRRREIDLLGSAGRAVLPRQLVHGDWWDNNVLFDDDGPNGAVGAVLDLGFMAEGERIDDLALPVWFLLLRDRPDPARDLETVAAMVDAYDSAASGTRSGPLSTLERRLLPLVVARQLAWSLGRWIPLLDEVRSRAHARDAASELPAAAAVLADLDRWWSVLGVL